MMKKFLILATLVGSVTSFMTQAALADEEQFNVRISPIGLLVGSSTLTLDIAISPSWTLGPTLSYTDFSLNGSENDLSLKGWSGGLRANWFSNGVFTSGWYVAPSLEYRETRFSFRSSDGSSTNRYVSGPAASLIGGYGWYWSNFNIMLGAGAETQLGSKSSVTVVDNDGNSRTRNVGTALTGEFTLGWKF